MLTEDFHTPDNGGWLGVPATSEQTAIYNGTNGDILLRVGALSVSSGMRIAEGSTVLVDETVYVRSANPYNVIGTIRVTR